MTYWRFDSFPELQHLSHDDRKRLLREHVGAFTRATLVLRALLLGIASGMLMTIIAASIGLQLRSLGVILALSSVAGTVPAYAHYVHRVRGHLRAYLEEAAKKERLPMCLHCGYDLTGNTSGLCPECGERI